ncbi:MAG TPA: carboxypeptidase-like regulatory domain-containing protein [Chitinophagaceae bacterium]|nr:carboxypeptidase-like regulatory domain-containing protein [Chitinophagaceae bacterium]
MKQKFLLLGFSLLGFVAVKAAGKDPGPGPGPGDGKKDDVNGFVIHAETRKPLKDVSITAYNVTKKEKVVITEEDGSFSFDDLKPGTYKFVFEKAGYRKSTKEKVVVKTDEGFQLNIEMIENKDFDIIPSPGSFSGL